MGYDMRWRKRDESELAAVATAGKVLSAAWEARDALPREEAGRLNADRARASGDYESSASYDGRSDRFAAAQDRAHAAYEDMREAQVSYFRLNIWGMGRYRGIMEGIGMAFDGPPYPDFPEPEDFGTTWDDREALVYREDYPDHEFTDESAVAATKFHEAVEAALAWHEPADKPGIPLHKFGSNDGWIVTPAECRAALRIWQDWLRERGEAEALAFIGEELEDTAYWLRWITYLAGAAEHDGFEVH